MRENPRRCVGLATSRKTAVPSTSRKDDMASVTLVVDANEWAKVQNNVAVRSLTLNQTDPGAPGGKVVFEWAYDTISEANHVRQQLFTILKMNDVKFKPVDLYVD